MNKKFLSAILFGALMVTSTGTFVSCKDYDDDIDEINATLTDLKSQIAALQTEVSNGNWVTSLVPAEGGFTVTFKDGKTYTIVSGKDGKDGQNGEKGDKGEAGKDGKGTEVTVKDGYWYLNGEKTEYLAVKKDQLGGNVKVPTVEDGYWVFYDAEGKPQKSEYKANGAAYAVEANSAYTLYIPDASGAMQTIKLPGAGSMISDIEFVGSAKISPENGVPTKLEVVELESVEFHAYKPAKTKDWKGNKPNLNGKEILTAYDPNTLVRINPKDVDASELSFTLVNSKGNAAPVEIALNPWSGQTWNGIPVTRAASSNGLYTMALEGTALTPNKKVYEWLNANKNKYYFTSDVTENTSKDADKIAYALVEASGMLSDLDVTFKYNATSQTITDFYFVDLNTGTWLPADNASDPADLEVGHTYLVTTNDDTFLYDAYLEFTNAASLRWGIEYNKAESPMTFKVTSLPDKLTTAPLNVTMHYVTKNGKQVDNKALVAKPKTTLTNGVVLCAEKEYQRKKNNDWFLISLDELWKALGENKTADWVEDVDLSQLDFSIYEGGTGKSTNGVAVTYAKNTKGEKTDKASEAKYLKVQFGHPTAQINKNDSKLPLNKSYNMYIDMKGKAGTDYSNGIIATVTIPFKLTKPDLNTILVKESGVFQSENLASAYMYHGDATIDPNTGKAKSDYKISRSFTDMERKLNNVGMTYTFELDENTDVLKTEDKNYKSSDLAEIVDMTITLGKAFDRNGYPRGYKQNLIVKFSGEYLGIDEESYKYSATYKYCIMSPIREGKVIANNDLVKVSATGKTQITGENVWAKTYNGEVIYGIFRTTEKDSDANEYVAAWSRPDIKEVVFSSSNKNIFEMVSGKDTPVKPEFKKEDGTITKASYIEVEGVAPGKAKLNAKITDIWGYSLVDAVDVEATVTPAN